MIDPKAKRVALMSCLIADPLKIRKLAVAPIVIRSTSQCPPSLCTFAPTIRDVNVPPAESAFRGHGCSRDTFERTQVIIKKAIVSRIRF